MLINTLNSNNVFGFFTTKIWGDTSQMWQYDKDAFLFSFINSFNKPIKMNVLNPEHALRVYPTELDIGYEVLINDEFSTSLNYGWSSPGQSYELPDFVNNSGYFLISNQSSSFFISELEVYQVDACWNSPCFNGGTCKRAINNNFQCICISGYYGVRCQYKILNSTIFQNSTILTQDESVLLKQVLNFSSNPSFSLIYQASRDGFGLKDFHSKCDGILNTLMVIKSTDSYVFGGFTTQDWTDLSGYKLDIEAFIFSKSAKQSMIDANFAIYQGPNLNYNYNNDFIGFGENDMLLNDNSNQQFSYVTNAIIGNFSFFTAEIEVYLVDGNSYSSFCQFFFKIFYNVSEKHVGVLHV